MAGKGRKTWTGEVLSVPDLQDYLQDQAVMAFDNVAERTAEIPAPTDGMLSYLRDSKRYEFHNGSTWLRLARTAGPWVTPVFSGRTNQGGAYPPLRYRSVPALNSVQVVGALAASAAAGTIFTIPEVELHPVYTQTHVAMHGSTAVQEATLTNAGAFIVGGTASATMHINATFILD